MKPSEYIAEFRRLAKQHFGEVSVVIKSQGIFHCAIRIEFSDGCFLDVYYNELTKRKDFSLIKDGERIFGVDNYRGWHIHPFENPSSHVPCDELGEEEVLNRIQEIVMKVGK